MHAAPIRRSWSLSGGVAHGEGRSEPSLVWRLSWALPRAAAVARPAAAPIPWPYAHLELGLASSPGGAAGLAAVAPFGLRYQYLAGGVNTGQDWPHWNPNGSFVSLYITESEAHRIVPVFSYYEIRQSLPGAGRRRRGERRPRQPRRRRDDAQLLRHARVVLPARGRGERSGRAATRARPVRLRRAACQSTAMPRPCPPLSPRPASRRCAACRTRRPASRRPSSRCATAYAPRVLVGYPISIWGTGMDIHLSHPSSAQVDQMAAQAAAFYRSLHAHFDLDLHRADRPRRRLRADGQRRGPGGVVEAVDFNHDIRFLATTTARVAPPDRHVADPARQHGLPDREQHALPLQGQQGAVAARERAAARICGRSCAPAGWRCSSAAGRRRTPTPASLRRRPSRRRRLLRRSRPRVLRGRTAAAAERHALTGLHRHSSVSPAVRYHDPNRVTTSPARGESGPQATRSPTATSRLYPARISAQRAQGRGSR